MIALLRLALVPLGIAIASKGLAYLGEIADERRQLVDALGEEIANRRAELAALHGDAEHQPIPYLLTDRADDYQADDAR